MNEDYPVVSEGEATMRQRGRNDDYRGSEMEGDK